MATWKKVIVSGSSASLTKIGLGTADVPSNAGEISASGKLFADTSAASGLSAPYNVVIKGASGEFMHTSSQAISPTLQDLNIGAGLKDAGGETVYDGSTEVTLQFDSSSAAGNGLEALSTAGKIAVKANGSSISVGSAGIAVATGSIVDTTRGLSAASSDISGLTAGTIGVRVDGSTIGYSSDGALTASFQSGQDLGTGTGIRMVNASNQASSYNGSADITISVDTSDLAGAGLSGSSSDTSLELYGAGNLLAGKLSKWSTDNGGQFENSKIEEGTGTVTIGSGTDTTTIAGNLKVQGNATFTSANNLKVADDFILMNSGSSQNNAFGIIGAQANAAQGKGWVFAGGATGRWQFTTAVDTSGAGDAGTAQGDAVLYVGSTSNDANKAQDGNIAVVTNGTEKDIYIYTS